MRKLFTATAAFAVLVLIPQKGSTAPAAQICANAAARNCFRGEIFLLDGNSTVTRAGQAVPIVGCASNTDCYMTSTAELFSSTGLQDVVTTALNTIVSNGASLAEWDEVVVFTADFGPARQPGPLFFRATDASGAPVNRVSNIGLGALVEPPADKPYLGIVDGGNVKGVGATPATTKYSPCGTAPRYATDPPPSQPAGALCAPGLHTYFDALAQATAALYGPHLLGADATTPLVAPPAIKTALVTSSGAPKFPTNGPSIDTWNALLDTGGSILGGNTWRSDGTGSFLLGPPTPDFDASAPYAGTQIVRFRPLDLYVLGFAPSSSVPALRSFIKATPADVSFPAVSSFNSAVGPNMGTRIGGVTLRPRTGLPATIPFANIVTANGGERIPSVADAPQFIRQLWVLVTKPQFLIDQIATAAGMATGASATAADDSRAAQAKEQATEIDNLQKARRAWSSYFYMLTGYTGRVVSTYEGNVDDSAYWEFADPADDLKVFSASGLDMEMRGSELVGNGGGRTQSLLSIKSTPGAAGTITFTATPALGLRIQGSAASSPSPNNVLTIRMRLPADKSLVGMAKGHVVLSGPAGQFEVDFPTVGNLVPDGTFRNYTILLSQNITVDPNGKNPDGGAPVEQLKTTEVTDFTGKDYDSFTLTPSNVPMSGIDIDSITIGNSTTATDVDKDCTGHYKLDGWLGADDNCPNLYNPDQADGNGDGVGDACEDFDGDGIPNACDDCAAVGGTGQQCQGTPNGLAACAVGPEDPRASHPQAIVLLLLGAVIAGLTLRRFRRRGTRPQNLPTVTRRDARH